MAYRRSLNVSGGFWVVVCMMILIVPWKWLAAFFTAVFVHECAHIIAVKACGGKIVSMKIGTSGIIMEITELSLFWEWICAMAGPAGSMILLPLARWMPRTAICAAVHLLYNLLPIYPLDGGRALRCLAEILFSPTTADKICRAAETSVLLTVGILSFMGSFLWKLGFAPLLLGTLVFYRAVKNSLQTRERAGTIVLP